MELENLLKEYGKSKGLGRTLKLDSSGVCTLLVNDQYLVTFEKSLDKEGFYVYSSIGSIPAGKEQEYSLVVLEGNLFGKETGLANIGYMSQNRTLVLFEYFDKNIDYHQFNKKVNSFLQYLFYWIVKLDSINHSQHHAHKKHETHQVHVHKKIFYA